MKNNDWNKKANEYASLAVDKVKDAYEYEINNPSILNLISDLNPSSVLDAGAGTGDFTKILKSKFKNVQASDGSEEIIKHAKEINPEVEIFLWDMEHKFPLEKKYDLVISKLVLIFIENLEDLAKEFFRILNKDGVLVISVHHPVYWYQKIFTG